ncbi:MAG: S8 family serine peptidase [Planctomycetota bacterium]
MSIACIHALVTANIAATPQPFQPEQTVPGQLIVMPSAQARNAGNMIGGFPIIERSVWGTALLVAVPQGRESNAARAVASLEGVISAEPNAIGDGSGFRMTAPDDTFFGDQWHHSNTGQAGGTPGADIETPAAWQYTTGDVSTVIAVLDTGIDWNHADFAGRVLPNGYDFVNEDADPEADHPHGPQVTACIVANADNAFGVAGVDLEASVLPIKVLSISNRGTTFDLIQGIDFAAARTDVHIISMSLINYPGSDALRASLDNATASGKVLISCGANNGGIADVSWPGASPATITIGSTTRTDERASFSGRGASIDFVAPGQGIVTIEPFTDEDRSDLVSGCSFATPIAAGVAGLIRAEALRLGVPFTHDLVMDMLAAGAEDQVGDPFEDTPGRDDFMGHGRINARATLHAMQRDFGCLADTNRDGLTTPGDFVGWILAFNTSDLPRCDQNSDGLCTPADFDAWILNFSAGC